MTLMACERERAGVLEHSALEMCAGLFCLQWPVKESGAGVLEHSVMGDFMLDLHEFDGM
jgi:hypothetical protein